jgi:[ribosomal protein S18]-alanine N-acetyltransferase
MSITGKVTEEVIRLDQDFFPQPWTKDQWLSTNMDQHLLFQWKKENDLVGYALFQFLAGDDTAHLLKILMLPKHRGQGESEKFWTEIVNYLNVSGVQNIYLEVESGNAPAIGFYQKMGFKLLRKNKAYYSNGEDALIMALTLQGNRV